MLPVDNGVVELLKDISRLHKELSEKYEELSMYCYPDDHDAREGIDDEDDDDDEDFDYRGEYFRI